MRSITKPFSYQGSQVQLSITYFSRILKHAFSIILKRTPTPILTIKIQFHKRGKLNRTHRPPILVSLLNFFFVSHPFSFVNFERSLLFRICAWHSCMKYNQVRHADGRHVEPVHVLHLLYAQQDGGLGAEELGEDAAGTRGRPHPSNSSGTN